MDVVPPAAASDPSSLLASLPEALRTLAARGVQRSYRKGSLIIEEGSLGDTLYLLLRGRVRAFSGDARGREVTYGVYGAGDYFGEMSLDGGVRSASVIAEVACVCATLTRQTLREHIAAEPEFAFELIGRVIRRARLATQSARNMALLDVYGRVVLLLQSLAVAQPDGTRLIAERSHPRRDCRPRRLLARNGQPAVEGPLQRRLHCRIGGWMGAPPLVAGALVGVPARGCRARPEISARDVR